GFNALVLTASLVWREIALIRARAGFLRQSGTTYSQGYVSATLVQHPGIAAMIVQLFLTRVDPRADESGHARTTRQVGLMAGTEGGFVPKFLPKGPREAVQAEGTAAYKLFISTLLDLADNLDDKGVVPPDNVLRHDDDDPYLVVAADKGTATFSDLANVIAEEHGFWLGDAFASGGSAGYDHKKMGITARGAWESVKRHFRELDRDLSAAPFTVVGVGDMSGDVFGNGLLREQTAKLVAAFDHRDIFIDPAPDPQTS